jgi:hypothetical protein
VSFRHAANLGALFTHDGNSETIYSTSTVDKTEPGTTTLDYWAVVPAQAGVPSTQQWLHATRTVLVEAATPHPRRLRHQPPTQPALSPSSKLPHSSPLPRHHDPPSHHLFRSIAYHFIFAEHRGRSTRSLRAARHHRATTVGSQKLALRSSTAPQWACWRGRNRIKRGGRCPLALSD